MSYTEDFLSALEEEKKKKKKKSSPVTQSKGRPSVRPSNKSYTEEFEETLQEQGLTLADFYNNRSSDIAPVRTDGVATPFGAGGALHKRFNTSANAEYYASQREDDEDDSILDLFDKGAFDDDAPFLANTAKAILGTVGDVGVSAAKGFFSFAEGLADLAGRGVYEVRKAFGETEADLADYKKSIDESTADQVFGGAEEYLDQYSVLGRTANAFAQGIGQYAAMWGTGGFLGKGAGLSAKGSQLAMDGILGASSLGSGVSEAYMGGATDEEAWKYGASSAALEVGFEKLFGGLGKGINMVGFNKGLSSLDDMTAKAVSKFFKSQTGKNVVEGLVKMGFEGFEELGTGFGQALAKKATYMSERELADILEDENLFEQFFVGSLVSGFAQGKDVHVANKTGRDFVTGNTRNEQAVIDKVVEDRIAEKEKDGTKLSGREKNKILDEVMRDMERGYIDTDTIEEVLGGDSYKSYQDTLAKEDAIKKEFETLKGKQNATLEEQARFRELRREYYRLQSEQGKARRTDLKNKLSQDVFNRVKNDRLVESYLDKARVGEDFQADLNKYKGTKHEDAAKKTLENAIKAGANNTNRVHDLVDMAADLSSETGYVYDFKDNEQIKNDFIERKTKEIAKLEAVANRTNAQNEKIAKLKDLVAKVQSNEVTVNGNVDSKGIVLNLDSAKPLNRIIGHEVTHSVEKAKNYEKMRDHLFAYAKSKGVDIDAELAMKALEYEGVGGTTAEAELVADLVGDYLFTDSDYVKSLTTENRNLAQRIYDEIKYFLTKATKGSKEERELLKVQHEFEKAFRESAEISELSDSETKHSLRTNPPPKETGVAYKVFFVKDGKLYPPMVANPEGADTPMGVWLDADVGTAAPASKTGRAQVKAGGKGTQGGSGSLAFRPGWHLGDLPRASQFDRVNPETGKKELFPENFVWAEVEYAKDVDYQEEAMSYGYTDKGKFRHAYAGLPRLPENGYYRYRTNPKPDTVPWIITGAMKVNRLLSDAEVNQILEQNGVAPVHRQGGDVGLDKFGFDEGGTTQYSFSSISNTFFGENDMSSEAFKKKDYKKTEGYQNYVNQCLHNYKQTKTDFAEREAEYRKEIEDSIDGIVKVAIAAKQAGYDIFDDATKRNTKDSKNRLLFSSLEPNSDYFTSSDISTICDKRKNFAEIYDDIVRAEEKKGVPQGKRFFDNVDNYFFLHAKMAEKGLTTPCRQCYVESMRKNLAPMASAFLRLVGETNPNNLANDQLYQQNGKNKGNLKTNNAKTREWVLEKLAEYDMTVDDLSIETLTTEDGLAQLKIQAPLVYEAFNSFYGQSKPKMPKSATPFRFGELTALLTDEHGKIKQSLVDKINSTGGFRLQSYSDFQIQNYTDVLQVIFEAGTLGLNGHAYTKVPAFLDATEGTNLKRNISIFMYKDGDQWKLDKNDSFPYDLEEIYDIVKADKTGNTGIIAVSQNADMSAWIMANDLVGYGIPFHKSGLKMGTVRDTDVKTDDGRTIKGYSGTIDHTKQQTEVWAKATEDHKALTKVKNGINIYGEDVGWDFANKDNLSKNELIEKNVKAYIAACEKAGYLPKFRDYVMNNGKVLDNVLKYAKELGFASQDATIEDISFEYTTAERTYRIPYGYYKFLGDFGMFAPDGTASPQQTLSLKNYKFDKAVEFFADAETLRRNEVLQQFANGEERQKYRDSNLDAEQLSAIVKQKRGEVVEDIAPTKYSLSEADQENAQKVIRNLKIRAQSSKYLDGYATYTAERMEREIGDSSASGIPDYAKSYITWVDPTDFVWATTTSKEFRQRLKEEAGALDIERLKDETQPIHLTVNFETGEIVGHEGRHRMLALQDAGIEKVAVIIDALNDNRHHTKPIEFMQLKGQRFSGYSQGMDMFLHNMLPLSQRYADTARELFTNKPKSGIQYSLSDSKGRELSPAIQNRFAKSKVVDEDGNLKAVYHGTASGEFTIFDKSKGNVEGDFGSGFYFTDNEYDVSNNYEGGGADFENKVARLAERIEQEEDIDYAEAEARARDELYKGSHLFEVYLNIENPAVVGETRLLDPDSYFEEYNREDYDSEEDYEGDVEQLIADEIDNLIWEVEKNVDVYSTDGLAEVLWNAVNEGGIDIEQLKANINNLYLEDSEGNFVGNEVTRQIIESLGYDGIIDPTVSGKWNMDMEEGTTHYIVFKPNQIKSVTNENPTDNPDIHLSLSNKGEEFAPIGKNDFFGKDFRKKSADDIAPVAESAPVVDAPIREDVNPSVESVVDEHPVAETANVESLAGDRDSFVSQQAMELYKEITSLKKGVRASKRLGYLLDHGHEWRSIKTALLNIRDNPNQVVNPNSAAESVAREMLGREYDDMVAELAEPSDVAGSIRTKMQHIQTEIANNERLREQSSMDYDSEIAEVQAEYDAKKNKNTLVANDLLRRIERLNRMKNTNDDRFAKRIGDLEARLEKMRQPTYKTAVQRKAKQNEYTNLMKNLVGDTTHWVDKKLGISYKVNTLRRNLRDVVRDANGNRDIAKADAIYDELQGKYNHNEAELKRESRRIKAVFADLNLNHAEDTYAHMLGEFRHNPDSKLTEESVKEFYEKNKGKIDTNKVDKAIEESRKVFDELIVRVNERLKEQGMKEIPYRQGYFPHFTNPKQGWLAKLFNWKTVDTEIPTSIAGLTETFNPERSWQGFSKQRKGDTTDYSLEQGLDTYIHGALDWIYHIEDIQKRRALENHIRYIHSEEGVKARVDAINQSEELDADEAQRQIDAVYAEANNPLNNFVTNLRAGTNTLANKKSENDRQIESDTNRKIYSVMTNLNNRISANMVVGSFSSALTNFIPITQSWMEVSPVYSLRGMKDTIKSTIRDDGIVNKSDFLTNRLLNEENLYQTTWDKISDKAAIMMEAIDNFTSQTVWRSKYLQNISEGMSETEAIKNADQFAENVIAGRSRGNQPTIFDAKNPITKIFTAFQLEVNNQYGYMFKDVPQDSKNKARLIKGYATAFLGAYAYNALYSSLVGRDAAFDPISILEDLFRDMGLFGDDDEEEEPKDILLNLTDNILDEVPFVGGLMGGGRIPISSALPYSGEYGGLDALLTDVSEGNGESFWKEVLKPLYYLALPFGGGQIKKTAEGLGMFSDDHPVAGSYTDSGNLRFPVEDTFGNRLQAGLFGQYANENARDYFDNGRSPLKEKQIQEFIDVDIPIRDYWEYREGLADQKTIEDKFDYIAGLDLPVSKKNILINNIVDREERVDLEGYEDFSSYDEFDFATKNPGKYAVSQAVGGYDSYVSYMDALGDITADKDEDGKSISGSRKEKVVNYIESLDIDYGMKIILFKSMYDSKEDRNTYNADIVEYLDSRDDISYEEMVTILTELGMRVEDNNVYWD